LTTVLAAGLVPLVLTACGSGRSPQTYAERATADAAGASLGDLEIRTLKSAPPAGGETEHPVGSAAEATMSIVNMGEAGDALLSVTTPVATSVEFVDSDGATTGRVDVPRLGVADASDFTLNLRGLTKSIRPGQYVPLTFTFFRNGRHELLVPVAVYTSPAPRPTHDVFEVPEGDA
jgi:copper(I)-binding protein